MEAVITDYDFIEKEVRLLSFEVVAIMNCLSMFVFVLKIIIIVP